MKVTILIVGIALMASVPATAKRTVAVRGHVTKAGVYVAPHTRTSPDRSRTNNWSSKPNINPRTGKSGTVNPYKPK